MVMYLHTSSLIKQLMLRVTLCSSIIRHHQSVALGRPAAREKYQVAGGATILDFAGESLYDAVDLIFANQWNQGTPEDGSDIDIYDYAYK